MRYPECVVLPHSHSLIVQFTECHCLTGKVPHFQLKDSTLIQISMFHAASAIFQPFDESPFRDLKSTFFQKPGTLSRTGKEK
jgi:hypothetical protein